MRLLVLGGTAWLGGEVAAAAVREGHTVSALARGSAGVVPAGVDFLPADRSEPGAYAGALTHDWDAVVDVSRQPSHVRGAVAGLAGHTACWVFISSASVYAHSDTPDEDEHATLVDPYAEDDDGWETYGGRKVACEQVVTGALAGRSLVVRAGLVAGPGDHTDRTGYWPLRFARPATADGAVLVPDSPVPTQVVDVRDLATWVVAAAEAGAAGTVNAAGPVVPLGDHLAVARSVAGHRGELVAAPPSWLESHGVAPWSGPRSLPLWLPLPDHAGFMARSTAAAQALGLHCRPLEETLADTLAWELQQGPARPRLAGLSATDEAALVEAARGEGVAG